RAAKDRPSKADAERLGKIMKVVHSDRLQACGRQQQCTNNFIGVFKIPSLTLAKGWGFFYPI
ncbi:MAG: hypothetical protein U1E02_00020, partial [Hydrogenophaga sp.]|nr:hypothetical protein [Hydrogenophaga sp.]